MQCSRRDGELADGPSIIRQGEQGNQRKSNIIAGGKRQPRIRVTRPSGKTRCRYTPLAPVAAGRGRTRRSDDVIDLGFHSIIISTARQSLAGCCCFGGLLAQKPEKRKSRDRSSWFGSLNSPDTSSRPETEPPTRPPLRHRLNI